MVLLCLTALATAADPFDLSRGLRDAGMPDLAVEYLLDLGGKPMPPEVQVELPLELAASRLAAADAGTDGRDRLLTDARAGFERFLQASPPRHARRPEAKLGLARTVAAQARGRLVRAEATDDPVQRAPAVAAVRPAFRDAANRFADLAGAGLDRGRCLFDLARTFGPKEKAGRDKALDEAKAAFQAVHEADKTAPAGWLALAWVAECEREKTNFADADRLLKQVRDSRQPAAAAGQRLARFFELRDAFVLAGREDKAVAYRKVRSLADAWLADAAKPSPEDAAARFYAATARFLEARLLVREDPKTGAVAVPPAARELLQAADREYRRLTDADTDYTARAQTYRTQAVRLLVGEADRPPAEYPTADEALMAGQVQLDRALKADAGRADRGARSVALFERARLLAGDATRDGAAAGLGLVQANLLADRPHQAAILGEHLARTAKAAATAARAGQLAVAGYLTAAANLPPDEADARAADRDRALTVVAFLEKTHPADPSTDLARLLGGEARLAGGDPAAAFALFARVPASSPVLVRARLRQAAAAYAVVTAEATPADQKASTLRKAIADLAAVPEPSPGLPAADARLAVRLGLDLAELHLLDRPAGFSRAEAAAAQAAARAGRFTELPPEDKRAITLKAEEVRGRAVFAQAAPLVQAGKVGEALGKLGPLLDAARRDGPTAKPDQPPAVASAARALDDFRRDRLIPLALQCRVRERAVDKAGDLLALSRTLGGSLEAGAAAAEALVQGVTAQADALRRDGKPAEASSLLSGTADLLAKLAAEPGSTPRVLLSVGRGLTAVGQPARAVELLSAIPKVPAGLLAVKFDDLDDNQRPVVTLDKLARLELVRAYRQAGRLADAEAVLADAVGTPEKPGWAAGSPQLQSFRREAAHLLEAKAAAVADPKEATAAWAAAYRRWAELANEFAPTLKQLAAGKRDPKSALLALVQLRAAPPHDLLPKSADDLRRGLAAPTLPDWAKTLFAPVKTADGGTEDGPYVREMRDALAKLEGQVKPVYFDLFAESLRCLTAANTALVKEPEKLAAQLGKVAAQMVQVERANPDLADGVRAKLAGLRADSPALKAEYDKLAR
jgi:hypothetical protein